MASKRLYEVPNPGQKKIEIHYVRDGGAEEFVLVQQRPTDSITEISEISVSLDGLAELISTLQAVRQYYAATPSKPWPVLPERAFKGG